MSKTNSPKIRLFAMFLFFLSSSLFAQRQEIGRVSWEFKNFPGNNIFEWEFKTSVPDEYLYNSTSLNNNIFAEYRQSWVAAKGFPQTLEGSYRNFIVRVTYPANRTDYPQTALMNFLGIVNNSSAKITDVVAATIANIKLRRPGNYSYSPDFTYDDQEYNWHGPNHYFIASYTIYRDS